MASYLCISVVSDRSGAIGTASVCTAAPGAAVKVGSADEIDRCIAAAPEATLVTWGGHRWLHRLGPAARARYDEQVDLDALFVAQHSFHIQRSAFQCVNPATKQSAFSVAALVQTIEKTGRLVWDRAAGGCRGWWTPDFFLPLRDVEQKSPPSWVTDPSVVTRPNDLNVPFETTSVLEPVLSD